jgi:outer membrane lipoprotein-sorting protein
MLTEGEDTPAMVPDNLRAALLAVTFGSLLVVSSVATGAAAVGPHPPSEQPSQTIITTDTTQPTTPGEEGVVEQFRDQITSLETVVMTVEREIHMNGTQTRTSEQRIWADYQNNRIRTEQETNQSKTIIVRNRSRTVTYNAAENSVSRVNNTGNVTVKTSVSRLINTSELAFVGTEQLNGKQTYRLSMTPTDTNAMSDSWSVDATLWIDAETYFPQKLHVDTDGENFEYEMTNRFQNVTLNTSISDDRFTIDVPDDAEEPSYGSNMETYESLSTLKNETNQTVPEPELPETYSFEEASVFNSSDYRSVSLRYKTDANETVTISARDSTPANYNDLERYEEVDIDGQTAYYTEFEFDGNTTAALTLPRGNTTVSIVGDLSKPKTIDIADSLDET